MRLAGEILLALVCCGGWPVFGWWLFRQHERALREVFGDESSSVSETKR